MKKLFSILFSMTVFISFGAQVALGSASISAVPSFLSLREDDEIGCKAFIRSLHELRKESLDDIEADLVNRVPILEKSDSDALLDETVKVYLLCAELFEFPKVKGAVAEKQMFIPGMAFTSKARVPSDANIESILPMYRNESGEFEVRYFFLNYVGPRLLPSTGLQFFKKCRHDFRPRSQVEKSQPEVGKSQPEEPAGRSQAEGVKP